jgi:hypothetical protein
MKIISEVKLSNEQIKNYRGKGYEVYYGYENPIIKNGESVGFILDTMYKSTIDRIVSLLYRKNKSKITILYEDKQYSLMIPEDWEQKYYDQSQHKWIKIQHPILEAYLGKRAEYFEELALKKAKDSTSIMLEYFKQEIPNDLEQFLRAFAPLYDVDVDYESTDSMLRAYANIKFYIDNGIEYSRDIIGQEPGEGNPFEVISFGDDTYLEDYIYKESYSL